MTADTYRPELEEAVASLCHARARIDAARARARQEYRATFDPADRFAAECYLSALGRGIDRLELALALLTDELPAAVVDELERPAAVDEETAEGLAAAAELELEELGARQLEELEELAATPTDDPSTAAWRQLLGECLRQLEEQQ